MYYINKIIGVVVSPVGLAIIGGAGALICAWLKRQRLAKWLGWLTVAWLWLWMTPIMTWVVGVPLEREFLANGRVPTVETFPEADAIVLLGGSMGIDTNHNSYAEMSAGADRVWQAARLLKAGKAPKVIATGDGAIDTTLPLLKDFGVTEESVFFLDAKNTEEEARKVGEFMSGGVREPSSPTHPLKNSSTSKVLLVTSAWHMKRARLMFEKYASEIEVVCAPADFEQTMMAENLFSSKAILPDANVLYLNSVALHEWVGIIGYKLFR